MPDGDVSVSPPPKAPEDWRTASARMLDQIVDRIVTLRVTTVIGAGHVDLAAALDIKADTLVTLPPDAPQVVASIAINTALGDMTQVLHPDFTTNPALARLHADAIAVAKQVRSDTIAVLTALVKDAAGWVEGGQKPTGP